MDPYFFFFLSFSKSRFATVTEGEEHTDEVSGASKYDGIPDKYLYCFVCDKTMWDGEVSVCIFQPALLAT